MTVIFFHTCKIKHCDPVEHSGLNSQSSMTGVCCPETGVVVVVICVSRFRWEMFDKRSNKQHRLILTRLWASVQRLHYVMVGLLSIYRGGHVYGGTGLEGQDVSLGVASSSRAPLAKLAICAWMQLLFCTSTMKNLTQTEAS